LKPKKNPNSLNKLFLDFASTISALVCLYVAAFSVYSSIHVSLSALILLPLACLPFGLISYYGVSFSRRKVNTSISFIVFMLGSIAHLGFCSLVLFKILVSRKVPVLAMSMSSTVGHCLLAILLLFSFGVLVHATGRARRATTL